LIGENMVDIFSTGNGKPRVNVVSWSKTPEIAQLSNFAESKFDVELTENDLKKIGFTKSPRDKNTLKIKCGSVEGFLQALKIRDPQLQLEVSLTHGKDAKKAGRDALSEIRNRKRICFLQGFEFEYASPIHRALIEFSIWEKFRTDRRSIEALLWTGDAEITHNMGKFDPKPGKTSLPKQVFTRILKECREMVKGNRGRKSFPEIYLESSNDALDETRFYQEPC
jgi:hypothetical protein